MGCLPRWLTVTVTLAVSAAGCFSDRGLAIEVDVGDTGATSVELYLGQTACDPDHNDAGIDCKSIAPPSGTGTNTGTVPLTGTIWLRDADARYTATVADYQAAFQLSADRATTLPIVIAIGQVGDQAVGALTLRDVAIPTGDARVLQATLTKVTPVVAGDEDPSQTANLTADRALVWTKQNPASSCAVVEHWQAGVPTRSFVVPSDDPDCDDVVKECNPSAYHGSEPGGAALVANCFAENTSNTCVLGSLGCSDDNGPATGTCAALETGQVCAPSAFCSCDAPAASGDPTCLQTLLGLAPTPRIDCVVPAQGAPGAFESCSGRDSAPIDLNEFYTGTQCRQPVIGSLLLDDFGTSHDFGGAEMELSNPNDACTFDITWKHSTRTSTDAADFGFVEVPTSTGALAIPIVLHFMQSDCVHGTIDAFNCTLAGNTAAPTRDPMWSCAP